MPNLMRVDGNFYVNLNGCFLVIKIVGPNLDFLDCILWFPVFGDKIIF